MPPPDECLARCVAACCKRTAKGEEASHQGQLRERNAVTQWYRLRSSHAPQPVRAGNSHRPSCRRFEGNGLRVPDGRFRHRIYGLAVPFGLGWSEDGVNLRLGDLRSRKPKLRGCRSDLFLHQAVGGLA